MLTIRSSSDLLQQLPPEFLEDVIRIFLRIREMAVQQNYAGLRYFSIMMWKTAALYNTSALYQAGILSESHFWRLLRDSESFFQELLRELSRKIELEEVVEKEISHYQKPADDTKTVSNISSVEI